MFCLINISFLILSCFFLKLIKVPSLRNGSKSINFLFSFIIHKYPCKTIYRYFPKTPKGTKLREKRCQIYISNVCQQYAFIGKYWPKNLCFFQKHLLFLKISDIILSKLMILLLKLTGKLL